MDINKFKTPLPLILIALLHIIGAILYGYELLLTEKEFNPNFEYYWIDLFLLVSNIIIGIGLLLKYKVAYVLFILEALLAILGSGFFLVFFFWFAFSTDNLMLTLFIFCALIVWITAYRYVRSAPIRNLYFTNEI